MNAEQWVEETLNKKIKDRFIILNDEQQVEVTTFCIFFRTAIEDESKTDKYVSLSGTHTFIWNDQEVIRTAEELGYQTFFDQWHDEGII
jgi:hypothetical protein